MPSDPPDDDDMSEPAFSNRQLNQLDEILDKRGFNALQLKQLDEILDKRGFNALQLKQLDARDEKRGFNAIQLAQLDARDEKRGFNEIQRQELEKLRAGILDDFQHIAKFIVEQFRDEVRLALEPSSDTAKRVERLEDSKLPERVMRLEAAVFPPPKSQRRRRG